MASGTDVSLDEERRRDVEDRLREYTDEYSRIVVATDFDPTGAEVDFLFRITWPMLMREGIFCTPVCDNEPEYKDWKALPNLRWEEMAVRVGALWTKARRRHTTRHIFWWGSSWVNSQLRVMRDDMVRGHVELVYAILRGLGAAHRFGYRGQEAVEFGIFMADYC
jgi:hypothetical protein